MSSPTSSSSEWRDIPGYIGRYQVSNFGEVRSLDRIDCRGYKLKGRVLRQSPDTHGGYPGVTLSFDGNQRTYHVADLVLLAFVGPRPLGCEVCHNDGVAKNTRLANLRWDTHQGNMDDQAKHGTRATGDRHGRRKLCAVQVDCIRKLAGALRHRDVADMFGVSRSNVTMIAGERTWTNLVQP